MCSIIFNFKNAEMNISEYFNSLPGFISTWWHDHENIAAQSDSLLWCLLRPRPSAGWCHPSSPRFGWWRLLPWVMELDIEGVMNYSVLRLLWDALLAGRCGPVLEYKFIYAARRSWRANSGLLLLVSSCLLSHKNMASHGFSIYQALGGHMARLVNVTLLSKTMLMGGKHGVT